MSWIKEDPESTAYNVIKVMSINPKAMQAVQRMGGSLSFGSSALTRVQEEAISCVVSVINKCRY